MKDYENPSSWNRVVLYGKTDRGTDGLTDGWIVFIFLNKANSPKTDGGIGKQRLKVKKGRLNWFYHTPTPENLSSLTPSLVC